MKSVKSLHTDEFGRWNGYLLVNKPVGITSHDAVNHLRKKLGTKKVGHAGALDPFAEGLLILLVGKATKESNKFLSLDKSYSAEVLCGISTDSGDIEGNITHVDLKSKPKDENIKEALLNFMPQYLQYVPVFSSVKVGGKKLRELARSSHSFEIKSAKVGNNTSKVVEFKAKDGKVLELELPSKAVKIKDIEYLGINRVSTKTIGKDSCVSKSVNDAISKAKDIPQFKFNVSCSKGTYIRQLVMDLAEKTQIPMVLYHLTRTRIGSFSINEASTLS